MLIVEVGKKYQGFGYYRSKVGGKSFKRVWFGWIALTLTQFHLKEFHDYIADGQTLLVQRT